MLLFKAESLITLKIMYMQSAQKSFKDLKKPHALFS